MKLRPPKRSRVWQAPACPHGAPACHRPHTGGAEMSCLRHVGGGPKVVTAVAVRWDRRGETTGWHACCDGACLPVTCIAIAPTASKNRYCQISFENKHYLLLGNTMALVTLLLRSLPSNAMVAAVCPATAVAATRCFGSHVPSSTIPKPQDSQPKYGPAVPIDEPTSTSFPQVLHNERQGCERHQRPLGVGGRPRPSPSRCAHQPGPARLC